MLGCWSTSTASMARGAGSAEHVKFDNLAVSGGLRFQGVKRSLGSGPRRLLIAVSGDDDGVQEGLLCIFSVYLDFSAIYRLTGFDLMGRPLKLQWLSLNIQALGRDLPSPGKNLPVHLRMTICVKAFDSSLDVETIRSILKEHFECHGRLKTLNTPVNSDNTSTGKAYVRFASLIAFRSALKLHGSILRGHKLCVTEWPEFPWYREERSKTISEGDAGLAGQHAANASSGTQELLHATTRNTPIPLKLSQSSCEVPVLQKGPNWHTASRGKRTVFMESNDD